MSTSPRGQRAGAAEASTPSRKGRLIGQKSGATASEVDSHPFSPFGKHSVVRGLLLEVGGVLHRDEDGSLSGVLVNELRRGLSAFLSGARASDGKPKGARGSSGGSSSRRAGSADGASSLTEKDVRDKYEKRMRLQSEDRARIRRMLERTSDGN